MIINNNRLTGQPAVWSYVKPGSDLGSMCIIGRSRVAQQEDGGMIKSRRQMGHVDFLNWVQKKLQEGLADLQLFEAGASCTGLKTPAS